MNTGMIIQEIAECIESASIGEELVSVVAKFCECRGIENFKFMASLYNNLTPTPEVHLLENTPDFWRKRYESKGYIDKDFRVMHCKNKNSPIIWPVKKSKLSTIDKKIISEETEFGIASGISFPFHGIGCEFGMFSASTSEQFHNSTLNNPLNQYELQLFGGTLFDYLVATKKRKKIKPLTSREKECLKWVAIGKTSWETSLIINVSERTVIFHVQNATEKMNTSSRSSAAVIALLNGEI